MLYIRGNRRDYDRWKDLGNPEWGWEDVLEYFKKSENMNVPELVRGNGSRYHRTGGYLNVEQARTDPVLNQLLRQAAVELKKEWIPDFNRDRHVGYGSSQLTIIGATRFSPAKAFLSPIKNRFNLHVIKNAMVEKILIDERNVATGVSFVLQNKIRMNAVANKEVIVAAGAINTPQLLMLSGIGRTEELEKFDIPTKANLNVGGKLQDHVAVPLFFKFPALQQDASELFLAFNEIDSLYEYTLKNRSQGVGNMQYLDTMVFLNTVNATDRYPDAQVFNMGAQKGADFIGRLASNFEYIKPIRDSLEEAAREAPVIYTHITTLNPKSRGKVRLASADPRVHPLIEANYFDHEDDLQTLVRGIRQLQELLKTTAFRTNKGELHRVNIPGCQQLEYDTDEYWECYVRHMTITTYHPVGTAKMGPSTDPEAVVDSRLRVKGIRGLRVIDASIMPLIVSGNTNAPTIMIGEMGSDFIKQENA
ncbi:AGAP003785-PB-like protein [Anopheles sinensis]|uniref:AGAP003785-PB-like protein n=1 Tax=Anopheles sinensis TaxID=74873 RepID=A0A084VW89_ANOSI|nr:AGAP003785-PB-like protein [Anopheles sinensis]